MSAFHRFEEEIRPNVDYPFWNIQTNLILFCLAAAVVNLISAERVFDLVATSKTLLQEPDDRIGFMERSLKTVFH